MIGQVTLLSQEQHFFTSPWGILQFLGNLTLNKIPFTVFCGLVMTGIFMIWTWFFILSPGIVLLSTPIFETFIFFCFKLAGFAVHFGRVARIVRHFLHIV